MIARAPGANFYCRVGVPVHGHFLKIVLNSHDLQEKLRKFCVGFLGQPPEIACEQAFHLEDKLEGESSMRALAFMGFAASLIITTPASSKAAAQPEIAESVHPEAAEALKRMSDYLSTLKAFELTSHSTLDVVTVDDQRVQVDAEVRYKVMRPGIWIDIDSDVKDRQYFYDGKTFTISAPKLNFYASAPAPATNREFLKAIYDRYGISLPLEDLFRWNDGDKSDLAALTSGFSVGTAKIDGVPTDHWAFRQGDFDWEVWIEQGDRPLPRKLVIVDRTDPVRPGYSARLSWSLNPALTTKDFTFVPSKDSLRIPLATLAEEPK